MKKTKPIKGKRWAYFAPDGNLQVRSIGHTRNEAREWIGTSNDWHEYERLGFRLHRIYVNIIPLP